MHLIQPKNSWRSYIFHGLSFETVAWCYENNLTVTSLPLDVDDFAKLMNNSNGQVLIDARA